MHVIKNVNLETVCGITSKLPENTLPEVAFAGKSNVGKSSLINGLMNRKSYARTSQQPGKTRPSISIILMKRFILSICRVTAMPKFLRQSRRNGEQ